MPFPITHLRAAERFLSLRPMPEAAAAAFLLGSVAPDGVHYRPGFSGEVKKISHLCPVSAERWGRVTENDKWLGLVRAFRESHGAGDPFIMGYCVHIITDIYNNREIWMPYCRNHPDDAAKGYGGAFYADWNQIDSRLYQELDATSVIKPWLARAPVRGVPGLAEALEVDALRHNVLYVSYPGKPPADTSGCRCLLYDQVLGVIGGAAALAAELLG